MKTKITIATTHAGRRIRLLTDDTLTLAFPGMIESTPQTLGKLISRRSLLLIMRRSHDAGERSKAARALLHAYATAYATRAYATRAAADAAVAAFDAAVDAPADARA